MDFFEPVRWSVERLRWGVGRLRWAVVRVGWSIAWALRATGGIGLTDERYPPDYGDWLFPAAGSYVVAFYEADQSPSTVIGRHGQVLVNGQQWDNWAGGSRMARDQLSWLLSCPADLDGDGELTVFDFLEFQTLFDAGDVRADVCYDGRFDIFDYLEFFNQFELGCR